MLSMFKDEHGKTVLNVTNCDKISDVKVVVMKDLGLLEVDQHMFSQMTNIEELDISGNCLDNIPESIKLPKLKKMNCTKNKFSDVMFVQQFPCLEEIDFAENDITFPDYCIASVLCPTLKRINNQDMNFKALNLKMETTLKPVINKVWAKHFAHLYKDTITDTEFDLLSEKFRIMLKHANVQTTKLVTKFKDFKLFQLIDQFLEDIRIKPGQGRGITKIYQRNSHGTSKEPDSVTEVHVKSKTGEEKVPIVVILNKVDGSLETLEATLVLEDENGTPTAVTEANNVLNTAKQTLVFEDEEVIVATVKKNDISSNEQSSSTKRLPGSKVKYWLYDDKPVPKKKDVKPQPMRARRCSLERYIVGSVVNSNNNKSENIILRNKDCDQQLQTVSNGTNSADTLITNIAYATGGSVSRIRPSRSSIIKEPVKKKVRFIDDEDDKVD